MTPEPMLVRAGAGLAGLAGLLLAAPAPLLARPAVVVGLVLLAALPAVAPGGPGTSLVALAMVASWVVATSTYGQPVGGGRVLLLAALLYLLHSLAALAAALPYDAVVAPDVLVRWLFRTGAVITVAGLLCGSALAGVVGLAPGGVHPAATAAGMLVAAVLATLLSSLVSRRPGESRASQSDARAGGA
jgi:hypothetical protein